MKAEERHRLHEHELERLTERARPFFERHATALLLGLAALLVLAAVAIYAARSFGRGDSPAWNDLGSALRSGDRTAERLAGVAEDHPDSDAAIWAKLLEGDTYLRTGSGAIFDDREGAMRDLADARKAFDELLERRDLPEDVHVRALYGSARALELSSEGNLKPAIERYEQVSQKFPNTIFDRLAAQRVAELQSENASDFYAWFSKQKPKPRDLQPPRDRPMPPEFTPPGETPATATPGAAPTQPVEAPRPAAAASADATPTESPPAE